MKFPKSEKIATKLLSAEDELEYVITQSLTDPPKFTLYKIEGDKPEKIQTGKDPIRKTKRQKPINLKRNRKNERNETYERKEHL